MSSLFSMNIRKRRSPRISHKCTEHQSPKKKECLEATAFGDLNRLPIELIHMILSNLTILELSKLCLASKSMLEMVEGFRHTKLGRSKFLLDYDVHNVERSENWPSDIIHSYFRLGLYMKRSSFLKSTSKRLKHISEYINNSLICKELCGDGRRCISYYCYGTFLHTVIAGWDDMECFRVLEHIHQSTQISKNVSKILMCSPGVLPHLEVYVRCFYRRAFVDVLRKKEDKAFWLHQILKPYPIIHQARLLQILFLAKTSVGINFNSTVRDRLDVAALSDLGNALTLLSEPASWSDDNIISVIDELIGLPSAWNAQNVAALLLNCGDHIIQKVLMSKAINNRFHEVVCIAHHLYIVSVKAYNTIKRASQCLWTFVSHLKPDDRIFVITELLSSLKDSVYDMVEHGGVPLRELGAVLEAKSQFIQDILGLAIDSIRENKLPTSDFTSVTKADIDTAMANASIVEE